MTILILVVAISAAIIALYWEQLLTAEQKLQYGLVFSAAQDYAARAKQHPASAAILEDYVDVLVSTGNLGRATYLSDLYGVKNERLAGLRSAIQLSLEAEGRQEVYALSKDPAVIAVAGEPAGQALRYLEGYHHALRGDWVSARNLFATIDEKQLAPALRPYLKYYLARSYRLIGNAEEQARISKLLTSIITDQPDRLLVAKARYNLIAWYLCPDFPAPVRLSDPDALGLAKGQATLLTLADPSWAVQKSFTELAEYYVRQGDYRNAWEMAQAGLLVGPEETAAKRAGEVVTEILEAVLDGTAGWGLDQDQALTAKSSPGLFTGLARCGARHGFAARVAKLLTALKPHIIDRELWEELRVGLAICYQTEADVPAMRRLMADANLRDLSDASLAEIYYQHGRLMEQERNWKSALEYYGSCVQLDGAHAAEAQFQRYAIIKRVQDPLNLDQAVGYLSAIAQNHPDSTVMPKAVEELLPLLIYRNETAAAQRLIEWVPTPGQPGSDISPEIARRNGALAEVAAYWDAYLAERDGNTAAAAEIRRRIPCRYWNYYEMASNYPPQPELATEPLLLQIPESAGEYLAGLGLTDSATEFYTEHGDAANPGLLYLTLANRALTAPLYTRQWHATELLETGQIQEQALLEYVLAEAYPRPYTDEVAAAAAEFGIDENLIWAVMKKESNFRPDAKSWAGAHGLMQVMEPTARWLNEKYKLNLDLARIDEPAINIRLGTAYLASQYEIFGAGKTRFVIHAYNGGDGNLRKWRDRYGADPALLTDLIPNEENEEFGKRVTRYYKMYEWLADR